MNATTAVLDRPLDRLLVGVRTRHILLGAAVACVVLQIVGGETLGALGAVAALPLAFLVAFLCDARHLPTLLVLSYPALGLELSPGEGQYSVSLLALLDSEPVVDAMVAGVALSAPLAILGGAAARVSLNVLLRRADVLGLPRWVLFLFFVSLVPVTLGALEGRAMGLNRWSQGIRAMLAIGGLLWGYVLTRRAADPHGLIRRIVTLGTIGGVLFLTGFLNGQVVFLVVGVNAGALPLHFRAARPFPFAVAVAVCLVAVVAMTLTTAAVVVLALGTIGLVHVPSATLRRWIVRGAIALAVLASAGLIWAVYAFRTVSPQEFLAFATSGGLLSYALFKLMADRGPLWLAAITQILNPPWIVVPAGRPLLPEGFAFLRGSEAWEFGAHNAVLELVRNVGWIAGAIGVAVAVHAILQATRTMTGTRSYAVHAVAAGFLGVAISGITTGNFPVQDVGFFLWALGGVALAYPSAAEAA